MSDVIQRDPAGFIARLVRFGNYQWCPRSSDGTASPSGHRAGFLVHVLTDQGFACMHDELVGRPGLPAPFPYPTEKEY